MNNELEQTLRLLAFQGIAKNTCFVNGKDGLSLLVLNNVSGISFQRLSNNNHKLFFNYSNLIIRRKRE